MGDMRNDGTIMNGLWTKLRGVAGLRFRDANVTEFSTTTVDPMGTAVNTPKGSLVADVTNGRILQKQDAGSTTNFRALNNAEWTKDATGFVDPDGTVVTYSTTNRTVTLTHASGFVQFLIRDRLFSYPSPWTVPTVLGGGTPIAHTNANGTYFLNVNSDTLAVSFTTTPWRFEDLQIAVAFKNASAQFGLRECHGFMPNQSHKSDHYTKGTWLPAAIAMTPKTGLPAASAAAAATNTNCPGVDSGDIYDEDIKTTEAALAAATWTNDTTWASGNYTTAYRNGGSGVITFNTASQLPYLIAGAAPGVIQRNPITSGSGSLADVTEDSYVNVLVLALPVTADAQSQAFRYIWVQGQQEFTTSTAAQAQLPSSWDFGELTSALPESVAIQMYTFQKNSVVPSPTPANVQGRAWLVSTPVTFTGSRASLTGFTGVAPSDHQTLSNRGTASATYMHPASLISTTTYTGYLTGVADVEAAMAKLDTYATTSTAGIVSAAAQSFSGAKTFLDGVTSNAGIVITGGTTNNYLQLQTGGTAGTTKLTLSGTTWQFGGTAATISEAGAANFGSACTIGPASSDTTFHTINGNLTLGTAIGAVTLTDIRQIGGKASSVSFNTTPAANNYLIWYAGMYYNGTNNKASIANNAGTRLSISATTQDTDNVLVLRKYWDGDYTFAQDANIDSFVTLATCTAGGTWRFCSVNGGQIVDSGANSYSWGSGAGVTANIGTITLPSSHITAALIVEAVVVSEKTASGTGTTRLKSAGMWRVVSTSGSITITAISADADITITALGNDSVRIQQTGWAAGGPPPSGSGTAWFTVKISCVATTSAGTAQGTVSWARTTGIS